MTLVLVVVLVAVVVAPSWPIRPRLHLPTWAGALGVWLWLAAWWWVL